MSTYLITIGILFLLVLLSVVVQRFYKLFARRHPELGPFREEGGGCGCCRGGACGGGACDTGEDAR